MINPCDESASASTRSRSPIPIDDLRKTLQDLEAQAHDEKRQTLRQSAGRPIELPSPEEATASAPLLAREQLRALFENGRLLFEP